MCGRSAKYDQNEHYSAILNIRTIFSHGDIHMYSKSLKKDKKIDFQCNVKTLLKTKNSMFHITVTSIRALKSSCKACIMKKEKTTCMDSRFI